MNTENAELTSLPHAIVSGKSLCTFPHDLYIPPDALEVFLESFTGPLDLLLYLIKKENINILEIPIAAITTQYMQYIELMEQLQLELAAEYLVMAAMLAEIKSRMLLPWPVSIDSDEHDPRVELMRKLREYEQYKKAAEDINNLPRIQREIFPVMVISTLPKPAVKILPKINLEELLAAFKGVVVRASMYLHHQIQRENLSVRERMTQILSNLQTLEFVAFENMFAIKEGRLGVIVTFMAMLELLRQNSIEIIQTEIYGSIYLKMVKNGES